MNQELERTEELMASAGKKKKKNKMIAIIILAAILTAGVGVFAGIKLHSGQQIKDQLKIADAKLKEGKYEDAIAAYDKVIKLDDKNAAAYEGRGDTYMKSNKPDKAVNDYRSALKNREKKSDGKEKLYEKSIDAAKQADDEKALEEFSNDFEKEFPEEAEKEKLTAYTDYFQDLINECEMQKHEYENYSYRIIDSSDGSSPEYIYFDLSSEGASSLKEFDANKTNSGAKEGILFAYWGGRIINSGYLYSNYEFLDNTSDLLYSDENRKFYRIVYRMDNEERSYEEVFHVKMIAEEIVIENGEFKAKKLFEKEMDYRNGEDVDEMTMSALRDEGINAEVFESDYSDEKRAVISYFNEHNIKIK